MLNEFISKAPLYRAMCEYRDKAPARFHTPGHKGSAFSPLYSVFGDSLTFDLTELPETDSLFEADGVIREAERLAAASFEMEHTLFSAGGATLCIQAMFRLVAESGRRRVVCARNIHRSAVNAISLLNLEPIWIWPRVLEGSAIPGTICPEDVEKALDTYADVACVYLTSPNYYGVISDIGGISRACKRHGVPLIVDNAHGAHLLCIDGGALHPARLGADLCCDSAHKTLPVLTGGAFLQITSPDFHYEQAKDAMALFGSTSPSYPVMLSLDIARCWMESDGLTAFAVLKDKVQEINTFCKELGFCRPDALFDPVRITLDTASVGTEGKRAAELLRRGGVSAEMYDNRHVVLLPSPFNTDDDFARLLVLLQHIPEKGGVIRKQEPVQRPEMIVAPAEAVKAPCRCVETNDAAGFVAAEGKCPCPPGVPIVMPGERITGNLAKVLKSYGVDSIKVVK